MSMRFMSWQFWAAGFVLIPALGAQPRLDSVASVHGNGFDHVTAMTIDGQGSIYLTGSTTSFDLGTAGTFQPRRASSQLYPEHKVGFQLRPPFSPSPPPIF